MPLSMTGWGGVIVGDAEGDEGMGEGGAGVRMIESREALSCAIELKWNLSIHPLSAPSSPQDIKHKHKHIPTMHGEGQPRSKILKQRMI